MESHEMGTLEKNRGATIFLLFLRAGCLELFASKGCFFCFVVPATEVVFAISFSWFAFPCLLCYAAEKNEQFCLIFVEERGFCCFVFAFGLALLFWGFGSALTCFVSVSVCCVLRTFNVRGRQCRRTNIWRCSLKKAPKKLLPKN